MNKAGLRKTSRGQIIVAMVALMLLSLALGISVAGGFIKNIRTQTETDDLSKAKAASESVLEKLLLSTNETLSGYIDNNSCGSACSWSVTDVTGKAITAQATLSYAGNSTATFTTNLETVKTFQLNLKSYPTGKIIDICWDTPASIYASYIKESGSVVSSDAYAYNAANTSNHDNSFSQAAAKHGHLSCFTVTASDTPAMIRLRAYYLNTAVYIVPEAGQVIPKQGILITAIGKSGDATKTTSVLKTSATLPSVFDYAVYQKSADAPLSNVTL
jgi:hypothetical protein